MAQNQKSYDNEFKAQAVKLAQEIGGHKAAQELGIPKGTMYTWIKAFKEGRLSANEAVHTPKNALSLNDELIELRKRVKEQDTIDSSFAPVSFDLLIGIVKIVFPQNQFQKIVRPIVCDDTALFSNLSLYEVSEH